MKILFCSPCPPFREFGAARPLIELVEGLEKRGWSCRIVSPEEVRKDSPAPSRNPHANLRAYLSRHAAEYDIVDYDHGHLPFPRSDFPAKPLFVARSVLLRHFFLKIAVPRRRFFKSRLRQFVYAWWLDRAREVRAVRDAQKTMMEADLVNVLTEDDRRELIEAGIPAGKIVTINLGLTEEEFAAFSRTPAEVSEPPTLVTVATFDARKGAVEMPELFECIRRKIPAARFRLLGARRSPREILAGFPSRMRDSIEIVPEYSQGELPRLLGGSAVGFFSSHIEGFGLGVLEMLAASIPVIAYDAPGPSSILPAKWLVPRGDVRAMSRKLIALLQNGKALREARVEARNLATRFRMEEVIEQTLQAYTEHLARHRQALDDGHPPRPAGVSREI
jgi:glycosyltransferase involved in cell wall biosynthesis